MKNLIRVLAIAATLCIVPGMRADDLSGAWKGSFDFNGASVPVTMNLKESGTTISGTVEGLPTSPAEIQDGKVDGDAVNFWVNTDYQGTTYKIVFKGKKSSGDIAFDFGTEDGSWGSTLDVKKDGAAPANPSATTPASPTAAAPASVPSTAAAATSGAGATPGGVTGAWKGDFDFNGTSMPLTFNLSSSGSTVTGNIEGMGPAPVEIHEGKLEGDAITFWVNSEYQGQTYVLNFKGKVNNGQIDFDFGTADGAWGSSVSVKKS